LALVSTGERDIGMGRASNKLKLGLLFSLNDSSCSAASAGTGPSRSYCYWGQAVSSIDSRNGANGSWWNLSVAERSLYDREQDRTTDLGRIFDDTCQ
jgi:hypothetical protein